MAYLPNRLMEAYCYFRYFSLVYHSISEFHLLQDSVLLLAADSLPPGSGYQEALNEVDLLGGKWLWLIFGWAREV
jgi:hypothetical protein